MYLTSDQKPSHQPTANLLPAGYDYLLRNLKQRIRVAQVRAALAVNRELVLLYWSVGRDILQQQARQGWGAKVVDQLAGDLRREFPDMTGLSPRNLKYMRAFAEAWPEEATVQQAAAQIRFDYTSVGPDPSRAERPLRCKFHDCHFEPNGRHRC